MKSGYDGDGYRGRSGGLWAGEESTLDFDEENDEPDRARDPFAGLKVVTVKELEAWIARHVRFDVARMATTAPLEFGRVAGQVATAEAKPGRGKKTIEITYDHHLADEVRDPSRRVYGPQSWRRADGTVASVRDGRGKMVDAKPCDHSVLGVVAIGPLYGSAFQVCIARDACQVHFKAEIAEKKKREQLRAAGKGDQVSRREVQQRDTWQEQQAREDRARAITVAAYRAVHADAWAAIHKALPEVLETQLFAFLWNEEIGAAVSRHAKTPDVPSVAYIETLVASAVSAPGDIHPYHAAGAIEGLVRIGRYFGVDLGPLTGAALKAAKTEAAQAEKAAAKAKAAAGAPKKTTTTKPTTADTEQAKYRAAKKATKKAAKKR